MELMLISVQHFETVSVSPWHTNATKFMPCISQLPANMSTTLLQCQQIYGGKYEVNAYLNPAP